MRNFIVVAMAAVFCAACATTSESGGDNNASVGHTYYVVPARLADAHLASLLSLTDAIAEAQPGDTIRIEPGTYYISQTIRLETKGTAGKPITLLCDSPDRAILDFSAQTEDKINSHGIDLSGDYWMLHGIEVAHAGSFGFFITGGHNTLDYCASWENRNAGMQIDSGGNNNLIENCQSYRNFDPKTHGEDANGFTAKHMIGPGNVFRHCFSYQNANDGWDLWMAPNPVLIEDCVSFRNGYNLSTVRPFEGNGDGFKLGGNYVATANICRRCTAIENPLNGFDQNHNLGALTVEDCIAIRCGKGFAFPEIPRAGDVTLRNNTSFGCQNIIETKAVSENNHWYADIPTGVLGPLPHPGHHDLPRPATGPTTVPAPLVVPPGAPEWGYPSDTPTQRDPVLPTTQPSTASSGNNG
jgi:hypothetical protein